MSYPSPGAAATPPPSGPPGPPAGPRPHPAAGPAGEPYGALASVVMFLVNFAWLIPVGRSNDDEGPGLLGMLLIMILGPLAASVIQLAVSRSREYEADASGAQLTGDPQRALRGGGRQARLQVRGRSQHLGVDPTALDGLDEGPRRRLTGRRL